MRPVLTRPCIRALCTQAGTRRRRRGTARGRGFTLVEMLLVLAILAIVTAVTVPSLVNSMHGNRRRAAVRAVVMAGRYARSMAVMKQRDMVLTFDLDAGRIAVADAEPPAEPGEDAEALSSRVVDTFVDAGREAAEAEAETPAEGAREALTRDLERVTMTEVEVLDGVHTKGSCSVIYATNGRCDPYRVRLVDEKDVTVEIAVDALGAVTTEIL